MSLEELADLVTSHVTVRTLLGTTGVGVARYADPVTVPCSLTRKLRFVRSSNGDQVASSTSLDADLQWADALTTGSQVTVAGRPTTVITVAVDESDDLFDGIQTVTAYLQ